MEKIASNPVTPVAVMVFSALIIAEYHGECSDIERKPQGGFVLWWLRRAIHGPMPVSGETLTNFQGHWSIQSSPENKAPRDWSIRTSPEIHMDPWLPNLSESSGPHRYPCIECFCCRQNRHVSAPKAALTLSFSNITVLSHPY